MDHNVNGHVTSGLRARGIDVLTAFEDGASLWDDESLLERATLLGRLMYTYDDDMLEIAVRWQKAGREFAGVVFAQQISISIGQAINDLELIAAVLDPADVLNQIQFLPLR